MGKAACDKETFKSLYSEFGAAGTASKLGVDIRAVRRRRRRIEAAEGIVLCGLESSQRNVQYPQRWELTLVDGIVLVGGDAHIWPGPLTTAQRAFVKAIKYFRPEAVILNGDIIDGARLSRFARIGWDKTPKVIEELDAVKGYLSLVEEACVDDTVKIWNLGNHDARFETRLANKVPEIKGVPGSSLKDHFPHWHAAWACWINDAVVVKHRWKGGAHAAYNNALRSGKSIITNHLHSGKVIPITDYTGTRYGVDTGTLACAYTPQFIDYTEDNPVDWRSGFAVLSFVEGKLLYPELVTVADEKQGLVDFRGQIWKV